MIHNKLNLETERGEYEMSLETLVVVGNEKVPRKQRCGGVAKGLRHQTERASGSQSWDNEKSIYITWNHNPKYEINTHDVNNWVTE